MKNKIIKPASISGFPEFSPKEEAVKQGMLQEIMAKFQAHGASRIVTPAVEWNEILQSKGGNDKEIFGLRSLHSNKPKKYSLKFDQTVSLARYIAQHQNDSLVEFIALKEESIVNV
jgi:histidyl-tRNA synthetase